MKQLVERVGEHGKEDTDRETEASFLRSAEKEEVVVAVYCRDDNHDDDGRLTVVTYCCDYRQ
jgi:hypothetical protein